MPSQIGQVFGALLLLSVLSALSWRRYRLRLEAGVMSINLVALISATLVIATPLVWAGIGELVIEQTGVLNLGIEGTMYAGAFAALRGRRRQRVAVARTAGGPRWPASSPGSSWACSR